MPSLVAVIVDRADFLGAGEHARRRLDRRARRDGLFRADEVGLIVLRLLAPARREARLDRRRLRRDDRRAPIFVGEAEPAAVALEGQRLARILVDRRVGDFLHAAVADHADEAFVQHRIAGDIGLAVAQDEPIGPHRRRRAAFVGDRVGDGEHVLVVDRDDPLEDEALAVVPGQRHRLFRRQRFRVGGPDGVEIGRLDAAGADIAGRGPIGVGRAARREQPDQRAVFADRLAIVLEHEVVELAALEVDRAAEARRVDGDAGARRERLRDGRGRDRAGRGGADRRNDARRQRLGALRRLFGRGRRARL